jgi:hypothetical protein
VAADPQARIYVGDMVTSRIWTLDGETFAPWLDDAALQGPNGLLAETGRLVVASWGSSGTDPAAGVPGHLQTVDLVAKAVGNFGEPTPLGRLDGIVSDGGDGYLVTDWSAGRLLHVTAAGKATPVLTLGQGTADLGIIPEQRLVLIPMMLDGRLVAYRLD